MKCFAKAAVFAGILVLYACGNEKTIDTTGSVHFTLLPSSQTGINFSNTITENNSVNLIANEYAYMGSGVGIGDFNNDGLPDIFFSANQASAKLYLNKGNLQFEDVTQKAGLQTSYWGTGVSIIDINNDGFDDIYVCVSGTKNTEQRKNKLYINSGTGGNITFTEQAAAYGLADTSYSTQAAFFDYDHDGDLDMYLMNHLLFTPQVNNTIKRNLPSHEPATDKLYRNEGIPKGGTHPVYTDVSAQAGIKEYGYGLGVIVSDFNNDNWPDIYVGNDYIDNDVLWLNNRNGTFSNHISTTVKHQSYSTMGVDAADINNDGLPDIATLDMLPENNERKKLMYSFLNHERYELERREGFDPTYMRNMLQLNNGTRNLHDTLQPFFSEIGQVAGMEATDWSWSVLLADFDNDGWKDIHITNGFGRDMLNSDFVAFRANTAVNQTQPGAERNKILVDKLAEYGTVSLSNYCYRSNGDLSFTNVSAAVGINTPALSNGCAYADLDNDGDLDLVVNNINQEAFVLRNDIRAATADSAHNFILLELKGDSLNLNGFGAKAFIYAGKQVLMLEQNPVRGYESSVDKRLHAGLGSITQIDSVVITWPGNRQQVLQQVAVNKVITVQAKDATRPFIPSISTPSLFTDVTQTKNVDYKHKETFFFDYGFQRLLMQKYSQLGPFITQGDINGDGLTDFFVSGAYNQSGRFFIQQSNGTFTPKDLQARGKEQEDLGCLLFDADGDKDLDLFINSGGYEYDPGSANYLPRLYKNDGKGNFTIDAAALPKSFFTSAQCVTGADYDGDGDTDLFVGGRISPSQYPVSPRSYILQNNNGQFTDVTETVCPALVEPGMITAAIWTDFNKDDKIDLVITGEWMPVRFFENSNGQLKETTSSTGLTGMRGQWRSLSAADIDKDGDIDIVAGNMGVNNMFHSTKEQPIMLYAKDIDGNGTVDPILCYYIINKQGEKKLYPAIGRDMFAMQVPAIKKDYLQHTAWSTVDANKLFSKQSKDDMLELVCEETRSVWLENTGGGKFISHILPPAAQWSPVNAIVCTDVDADGNIDILLAGNEYQAEVMQGRYDASYGIYLKGDGKGNFSPQPAAQTGFVIDGDVKDMQLLNMANKERLLITAINDEHVKVIKIK